MDKINFVHLANKKDFLQYLSEKTYNDLSKLDLITYSNEDNTVFVYKSRFTESNISISYDHYIKILYKINANLKFGPMYRELSDISKKYNVRYYNGNTGPKSLYM